MVDAIYMPELFGKDYSPLKKFGYFEIFSIIIDSLKQNMKIKSFTIVRFNKIGVINTFSQKYKEWYSDLARC